MNRDWKPAARRIAVLLFLLLLLLLFLVVPGVSWANTLDDSARQLARKILATLARDTSVVLDWRNLSSLSAADVAAVRRALETQLTDRGVRLVRDGQAGAEVRVTLSENVTGYVWVAEIQSDRADVAMVRVARSAAATQARSLPLLAIRNELVWEQGEPILDVALVDVREGKEKRMVVLEPARIRLFRWKETAWEPLHSVSVPAAHPPARDPRGRLDMQGQSFEAYLPSVYCRGDSVSEQSTQCYPSDEPWPLPAGELLREDFLLAAPRNFFLKPETVEASHNLPLFYSAAAVQQPGKTYWIYAGLDGRARLYGDGDEPEATFSGWGSDIAAIKTNCGNGGQVLATRPGDWTETDAVTAYEIAGDQRAAVSPPLDFPGPVTALWPEGMSRTAIAVVRNLETGRYEAHRLSVSCSR